jgi:hypothetical protein
MNESKEDLRPRVFVSHIHEEAALGEVVKDELQDAFAQRIAVFVSSDRRDNPGGQRWLEKIERELKDPQTRTSVPSHEALLAPERTRTCLRSRSKFCACWPS